ncbi:MAG: hypothetical protein RL518_2040 [Pseudomonadota bacterium]|jgi:hypothetical protein
MVGYLLVPFFLRKTKSMRKSKAQVARSEAPVKSANFVAKLVLEALDRKAFRDGRAIEFDDPLSSGLVRIQKDPNGRIHFRTPRVPEASVRLNPGRNRLLYKENVGVLEYFLEKNPLILAFLDETLLRSARR